MASAREDVTPHLTVSQEEWLRIRGYLAEHRHELSGVAAELYPDVPKVAGTPLLTTSAWLPNDPVPLQEIELHWAPASLEPGIAGGEPLSPHLRPNRPDGSTYPTYSAAMGDLAAPRVFENRSTYRLCHAELGKAKGSMFFESGTYFDGINVGEACAHELAATRIGVISETPLRDAIGNPCDPTKRPTNLAISALTLRHDRERGEVSFPLHWRDPAKVGHAGGLYMVVPVGIFQATGDEQRHHTQDFSLWHCLIREYSEELLGEPERTSEAPIDYSSWPFAARMTEALNDGGINVYCLGIGVDPLTFATDLLTAVVFEAELYDDLFGAMVSANEEGQLVMLGEGGEPRSRFPFTQESVNHLTGSEPMQAAGAALLRLAWRQRAVALRPKP
jgi:hypothetical protein